MRTSSFSSNRREFHQKITDINVLLDQHGQTKGKHAGIIGKNNPEKRVNEEGKQTDSIAVGYADPSPDMKIFGNLVVQEKRSAPEVHFIQVCS